MKQATLNQFFKQPTVASTNAVISANIATEHIIRQPVLPAQRGVKRKASGSADPRREYEETINYPERVPEYTMPDMTTREATREGLNRN